MKPRVICFDLWKTLVGESSRLEDFYRVIKEERPGLDFEEFIRLDEDILMRKEIDLLEGLKEVGRILGISSNCVQKVYQLWRDSCDRAKIYDDVVPVLSSLRAKGCKLVLISNTTVYGWSAVQRKFCLDKYFDFLALSFTVGLVKPDPGIFLAVEKKFRVQGEEVMMVGDSTESDIAPAKERNWQTKLVRRPGENIYFLLDLKTRDRAL